MIRVLDLADPAQRLEAGKLRPGAAPPGESAEEARRAIAEVRERGDQALPGPPLLDAGAWDSLAARCPATLREALALFAARVRGFHARQLPKTYAVRLERGGVIACVVQPVRCAGCLVPDSRPSAAILTAAVARAAGVPEVIVATPPREDGSIAPEVAAAARIAGATRVLLAGGPRAVAALAFGTESVPRADVVVGTGDAAVAEAKRQLAGAVRVELAGPAETVIVADASADARAIAADLAAQAESDPLGMAVVVTAHASVPPALAQALEAGPAAGIRATAVVARDLAEALAFADALSPQRLLLLLEDAPAALESVPRAAAVFLGACTPADDCLAGLNQLLPAGGTARFASPAGATPFLRFQQVVELGREQLEHDAQAMMDLARAEGAPARARAIAIRGGGP